MPLNPLTDVQAKLIKTGLVLAMLVLCFIAGYMYKAHQCEIADAQRETKQTTAQTTTDAGVKASDNQGVERLQAKLAATIAQAKALQKQIEDERNARQNVASAVDCRVSDGLRDEINRNLTTNR